MNYGEKIAQLRKEKNLTQKDLGDKLNISPQAVSKWENGLSQPDIESLRKISELFEISIDDLLSDEELSRLEPEQTEPFEEDDEMLLKPQEPEVPVIGVCHVCRKKITSDMEYKVATKNVDGISTQEMYCMDCFEDLKKQKAKEKEEKKQREHRIDVSDSYKVLYKGLIWGGVAAVLTLIATIVAQVEIYFIIIGTLGMFALVAQILWGNWLGEYFFFFCRSFKAPFGLIFELSLDGIIWLLTVKLCLWIICGILSILFFLFGLVTSALLALICAPVNIPLAIINARKGELVGF